MTRGTCPLNPEMFSIVDSPRPGEKNVYRAMTNDELWAEWDRMDPLERKIKSMTNEEREVMQRLSKQ